MTRGRIIYGSWAEEEACRFLKKKGYEILERNYRTPAAEIDIVAREGGNLVFVEVKARSSLRRGHAREAVGPAKQKKILTGAMYYIKEKRLLREGVRFDVVTIQGTPHDARIEVIPHAFEAC